MPADDDESLDALLARLKAELTEWEGGERDPDELRRLIDGIERRLDPEEPDDDSVLEELEQGVVRFESSHPTLAGTLRKIADTLGGVGL
ncbi:MAG: hypothetical protein QOH68_3964 [Nocardioidaceae bacterium]|nr:hypothetical protein [Nocardioidaceae bacterium]